MWRSLGVCASVLLVVVSILSAVRPAAAYAPQKGDYFDYSEVATVNNGQGSYTGYTDQTLATGAEQVVGVSGTLVSSTYRYSYQFSNNQGNSSSDTLSGNYTWSLGDFTYVNGTDNQVGYSKPIYVWFAMNPQLSSGSSFYVLNTQFTIQSKNFSFHLPSQEGRYVQTIQAMGTGEYQRNDAYGVFSASYTWEEYFDPTTGYIVGYSYIEQDSGQYQGQPGSFTYNDTVYVTSTSYALAAANPPPGPGVAQLLLDNLVYLAVAVVLVVLVAAAVAIRRRRRRSPLLKHSTVPYSPPQQAEPWRSNVDLGAKPPEQVVIRDVAKVNCRYCGTLIPTTADRCPYCGGPRQ